MSATDVRSPRRRWSRRKVVGVAVVLLSLAGLVTVVASYLVLARKADRTLSEAVTEADRLDPGWRLGDMKAARDRDVIPQDEDAGALVIKIAGRLGEDWLRPKRTPGPPPGADQPLDVDGALRNYPANHRLGADVVGELHQKLGPLRTLLDEARPLSAMTRGRFPLVYNNLIIATLLPHTQQSRQVAVFLRLAAIDSAERGEIDRAIEDCRGILGVASAVGDEPFAISQLVRIAEDTVAIQTVERVLAQGQASDAALAALQARLALEARTPFNLISLRGERAASFDMLGKIADGTVPVTALTDGGRNDAGAGGSMYAPGRAFYRYNQGLSLGLLNRAVEIAKRPLAEQRQAFLDWETGMKPPARGWEKAASMPTYLLLPALGAVNLAGLRCVAMLNVAQVTVAVERFRIANGRWPVSLAEIPKPILPVIPIDPFSGGPIRLARPEGGCVVYSVGSDGADDSGAIDPTFRIGTGTDWGCLLFDPSDRRLPPFYEQELPSQPFLGEPLLDATPVGSPGTLESIP